MAEKATPVTPDEADDIRVTLDLDNGSVECKIITEDEEGLPRIENIESDDEYEAAADRFDELLDDEMFDDI